MIKEQADIYKQHDAAFAQVAAYAITNNKGELVGKIAFKFPRDGAGRLYAYFHLFGMPMFRGHAGGYGYDKQSAAVANAFEKIHDHWTRNDDAAFKDEWKATITKLCDAMNHAQSGTWSREIERVGYHVYKAV